MANIAVQKVSWVFRSSTRSENEFRSCQLYYDTDVKATTAVLATFSTACFGLVGTPESYSVNVHVTHTSREIWTRRTFTPTYGLSF